MALMKRRIIMLNVDGKLVHINDFEKALKKNPNLKASGYQLIKPRKKRRKNYER